MIKLTIAVFMLVLFTSCAGLARDQIADAINEKKSDYQACFKQALKLQTQPVHGKVIVQFYIEQDGQANDLSVVETTLHDEKVENCILSVIRKTSFSPHSEEQLKILYPFKY